MTALPSFSAIFLVIYYMMQERSSKRWKEEEERKKRCSRAAPLPWDEDNAR
jgi:hypothetical protein